MVKKLLIDTNILLDAAIASRAEWAAATILLEEIAYGRAEGYLAASSLKDVYYVLTKYCDEASARKFISALTDLCEIVAVDASVCKIAMTSNEPDYEDGVIRACAESLPVDFIISRDKKAFKHSTIRRLSAQDFLDIFSDVEKIDFDLD